MTRTKLFILAILFAMLLSLAGVSFAQESPYDRNTEVYYEANFKWDGVQNTVLDVFDKLQQVEILEPVFAKIAAKSGISLKDDVFSWLGNGFQFGIIGDDKTSVLHTSMKKMLQVKQSESELQMTVARIRMIKNAVEIYQQEKKKLPSSLAALSKDFIDPQYLKPLRGKSFTYRVLPDNRFEIRSPKDKFRDLGIMGEKPSFESLKGLEGDVPRLGTKFEFKNWLLAIKVRDSDKAREAFPKIEKVINEAMGKSEMEFKQKVWNKYIFRVTEGVCYTFCKRQVFIADTPATLEKAIVSMQRADKNIYTNKVFKTMLQENPMATGCSEILFIDLKKIDLNAKLFNISEKNPGAEFLNNLYYMVYYLKKDKMTITGDVVINFDPDMGSDSILHRFAKAPSISKGTLFENLPGNLPLVASYNLGEIWSFFNVMGQKEASVKKGMDEFKNMFGMMSGLDFESDIMEPTGGELAISYQIRDAFISGLLQGISAIRNRHNDKDEDRDIDDDKDMEDDKNVDKNDEDTDVEPKGFKPDNIFKKMFKVRGMPFTFFMEVKDKDKIQGLAKFMQSKGKFVPEYYQDIAIYKSDKISYCIVDDLFIIHTFPGTIKMKQFINQLKVKRVRLGETTRYRDFMKDVKGKVLFMQFQDAEWAACIAKGFMLFFIPEFKDYADKVGQYRESWSSMSITERGLQIHTQGFYKQ